MISGKIASNKKAIIWFRTDLRLHDNEALHDAVRSADEIIPVYVFDERIFKGESRFGLRKIEKFRAQFIIESVLDLRNNLRSLGSDLIVRVGKPENEIFQIANKVKSNWVFCLRERTQEEVAVQDALEKRLWTIGQEVRFSRGKMLYYTADLPFPVNHTPDVFSSFKKEIENITPVRTPLPHITKMELGEIQDDISVGTIPCLADFDLDTPEPGEYHFKGGETAALHRLKQYIWEDHVNHYKKSRNELKGLNTSSKLSPWLSTGCLSPKLVYSELKAYEEERGANQSTYWLYTELLWRDFFRLIGKKYEEKIFLKGGIKENEINHLKDDYTSFELWKTGKTGVPIVDANMIEINTTGFMSNRGRQLTASYLINDLKVNWQMGAYYFETYLIDYDPCSNYGNWNYLAGVGNDPRKDRYFNLSYQTKKYDPELEYVRKWIPKYREMTNERILELSEI